MRLLAIVGIAGIDVALGDILVSNDVNADLIIVQRCSSTTGLFDIRQVDVVRSLVSK